MLDELCKCIGKTMHPGNVQTYVARAKDLLSNTEVRTGEYTATIEVMTSPYRLVVTPVLNKDISLKTFWGVYGRCSEDNPVVVGVLQRIFFLVVDPESGDEVYMRSRLVNLGQQDAYQQSPILAQVLKTFTHTRYARQYMSSGDVAAAGVLLELFRELGIHATGARLPDVERTTRCSCVILGTGRSDKAGTPPLPDMRFIASSRGIEDAERSDKPLEDAWGDDESYIFALLSQWEAPSGNLYTAIHANSAAAVEGVCVALANEGATGRVLKVAPIDKRPLQIIFRVGVIPAADNTLRWHAVAVWVPEDGKLQNIL